MSSGKSDGSSADYYKLPPGSAQLQDLISYRDMNAQMGEIFRACYRYGQASHSDKMRDAKKIKFYIEAEIARLSNLEPNRPKQHKVGFCSHGIENWMNCVHCQAGVETEIDYCIHGLAPKSLCPTCNYRG